MRKKILITVLIAASYLYCLYFVLFEQSVGLSTNLIFAILSISSLFILPAIISKLITKKSYFGVGYIIATLVYPLSYLCIYFLSKWFSIDAQALYRGLAYAFLSFTMLSIIFLLFRKDLKNYVSIKRSMIIYLGIFLLLIGIYYLLGIKTNALLSTDFLQHNAVAIEMGSGKLCLTPNQCSNLFQKLGYTTYFHSIQAFVTVGFNLEAGLASTIFNFSLIATFALVIAKILNRYFKNKWLIILGLLTTISVFEIGAYSFTFAIPQTFALFLFLNILAEKKLKLSSLLFTIPILLMDHFILGPVFTIFAFIYYIFTKKLKKHPDILRVLAMTSILGAIVAFLANFRGFSIEKFFQLSDVQILGSFSNYYFPDNVIFLFTQYGFLLILFLVATIYIFIKKKALPFAYYSVTYVAFCLIYFFLAPTYASKFLAGISLFMSFSIVYMINNLGFKKWLSIVLSSLVFLSTIPFYFSNMQSYATFYTQNSGEISGMVKEDKALIEYLKGNTWLKCQIVSDPYTQLIVRGNTRFETAGAQYQSIATRQAIMNVVTNPENKTYEALMEQRDVSNHFCFLLTSRIESVKRYININEAPWLNNLYDYEIDNNYGINNQPFTDFMLKKDFKIIYSDFNNLLFTTE
jgi:hypothetical protein